MFIFHQALNYLFSNENTSIDSAAYVSIRICICIFMSFLWGAKGGVGQVDISFNLTNYLKFFSFQVLLLKTFVCQFIYLCIKDDVTQMSNMHNKGLGTKKYKFNGNIEIHNLTF